MQDRVTVVYLTRVRLPAFAPQSAQVLATAHALAVAGADVYLFADRAEGERGGWAGRGGYRVCGAGPAGGSEPGMSRMPAADLEAFSRGLLEDYGLAPHSRLHLSWLASSHPLRAGLAFRRKVLEALSQAERQRSRTILLSRRVDYAADFLRFRAWLRPGALLVHEWHYVNSANALEAGRRREAVRDAGLEQRVVRGADGHIVVSHRLAAYLARRPPRGPVRVIPNGGPAPAPSPRVQGAAGGRDRWPSRRGRVVYAGLFRRPQDFRVLLDAVRVLPPGVDVVVVGGDDGGHRLHAVMRMARRKGIPWMYRPRGFPESREQVPAPGATAGRHAMLYFTGPRTVRESRRILARGDVAVAAFQDSVNMRWFACPLKILEYHAAGIPLVSTDHPTVREQVEDGRTGLLVPPGDGEAMARAVLSLLSEPGKARALAAAGLARAERATWLRRGEELLAWFRDTGTFPPGR